MLNLYLPRPRATRHLLISLYSIYSTGETPTGFPYLHSVLYYRELLYILYYRVTEYYREYSLSLWGNLLLYKNYNHIVYKAIVRIVILHCYELRVYSVAR
jgi:hypothetical protein